MFDSNSNNNNNNNYNDIDNDNNDTTAIQLNCYSNSIIQKDIQQREIVIVDTLFSLCGGYMVASNNIGCICVWKLEESLHPTNIKQPPPQQQQQQQQQQQFQLRQQAHLESTHKTVGTSFTEFYKPHCTFRAHAPFTPINKIHFFNDQILASAGENDIKLWSWEKIKTFIDSNLEKLQLQQQYQYQHYNDIIKLDWKLIYLTCIESPRIEGQGGQLSEKSEINGIDSHGALLYFASGNNNAYSYDLTTSQIVSCYKGHTDYLHTIKYNSSFSNIITSSEDSTVRLWDTKSGQCVSILNPFYKISFEAPNNNNNEQQSQDSGSTINSNNTGSNNEFSSIYSNITLSSTNKTNKYESNFNQWCGPLDLDETGNWLAVGGSTLSLWYLGKLNTMVSQLPVDEPTYSIVFDKEKIITCGGGGYINYFALDGRPLMKVPSSSKILYSLSFNPHKRNQILVAGGTSPFINTFINQENIAFSYYFINDD
ncbi:hypothetical protein RB653_008183 [Dictyostelium firmibasis]|uniref:WD40 repeat-containing protein n=1 Tax=Dictyostelium firmibasis TaxID=79012 RepID=A0AAN7YTT6_9MYCE